MNGRIFRVVCIVITQNGNGSVYTFPDKKAARLHPITQAYDVFASDSSELTAQFGRGETDTLIRFAEGRDRSRLVDAVEIWKSEPRDQPLPFEFRDLIWKTMTRVAQTPPSQPEELVRLIMEDRKAMEGKSFHSRSESPEPRAVMPTRSVRMTEEKTKKARIKDEAVIKILADKNPKRGKSAERFALYKDGMTVKEAKEAGVTAADITYDTNKEFISVTEPEASEA